MCKIYIVLLTRYFWKYNHILTKPKKLSKNQTWTDMLFCQLSRWRRHLLFRSRSCHELFVCRQHVTTFFFGTIENQRIKFTDMLRHFLGTIENRRIKFTVWFTLSIKQELLYWFIYHTLILTHQPANSILHILQKFRIYTVCAKKFVCSIFWIVCSIF